MTIKDYVSTDKINRNVSDGTHPTERDSSNPAYQEYQENTNANTNTTNYSDSGNYHYVRPTGM